MKHPCYCSK